MDYEKKYKETIAWIDIIMPTLTKEQQEDALENFPELAESENERIRKEIVRFIQMEVEDEIVGNKWLAWLEKQGNIDLEFFENSENEKREFVGYGFLKCKGDFLSFKEGENYWLEYVGKDNYNVRSDNLLGQTFHITPQQLYTVFRPTTWLEKQGQTFTKKDVDDAYLKGIFDTKQGKQDARYLYLEEIIAADDIYQMSMNDAMVNEAKEKAAKALSKLGIGKLLGFEKQGEQKSFDYESANIQQKNFAPKQEPKKIEDEIEIPFGAKDSELQEVTYYIPDGFHAEIDGDKVGIKKGEKPAAWTDEDERMLMIVMVTIEVAHQEGKPTEDSLSTKDIIDWLKSLKERITWKPSKEQMETLEYYMHTLLATEHKEVLFGLYNDLKKI